MTTRGLVRIALGILVIAAVVLAIVIATRHPSHAPAATTPDLSDPLVVEFRSTERLCIGAFNDALARQRANTIDEVGLAAAIETEVLPPWQTLATKLATATPSARNAELYAALRRYVADRQTAWQAYAAGLRAGSDEASRAHYDAYHAKDAEADTDAREIGRLFRSANP